MRSAERSRVPLASFKAVVIDAPVSYSVYSAFSFYGARRGGELPGTWLSAALGTLGHELAAIRQTLYRMERSKELASRMEGRTKCYRLTAYARAEAEAGLAKIMQRDDAAWDGEWTLVQLRPGTEDQVERERLREIIRAEGFAQIGAGLFIHPHDRSPRLLAAAKERDAASVIEVFRGRRAGRDDRDFVARHWDLGALAARYRLYCDRYGPIERRRRRLPPDAAFVLRFAVVFDFLETAWQDPELAHDLLPRHWPGHRARDLARALYDRLLPDALSFGDSLVDCRG